MLKRIVGFLKRIFKKNTPPIEIVNQIEINKKVTSEIDYARFYTGYDFKVNSKISIIQPTVGDIVNLGESRYYQMIHSLTAIPSDHISELWDNGVDFQKVPNIEFLFYMTRRLSPSDSSLLFGDTLDFQKFEMYNKGEEVVMYDNQNDIMIDVSDCEKISQVLCSWHGIKKEPVSAAGPMALRALIEIDRQEKLESSQKKRKSSLIPMLSSAVNHEGFKYNLDQALELKMFFFTDCLSRIGVRMTTDRLAFGYYSGSIDTKKFQPEKQLNWMRDLYS